MEIGFSLIATALHRVVAAITLRRKLGFERRGWTIVLNALVQNEHSRLRRPATGLPATLFFLALAACFVELFWAYYQLPERVRAHFPSWFHLSGEGPRWIFVAISGLIPVLIALAVLISIRLVKREPERFLQIPNRDYWLSAGRREQTVDSIVARIYLLGAIKFVADAILIYAAVRANLAGTSELDPTLLFSLAAGFIMAKIALATQLLWRLRFARTSAR
jgi:hypothetical protein